MTREEAEMLQKAYLEIPDFGSMIRRFPEFGKYTKQFIIWYFYQKSIPANERIIRFWEYLQIKDSPLTKALDEQV